MGSLSDRVAAAKRRPVRITITIPNHVFKEISDRSSYQGRSLSNLAAFLLEESLETCQRR